MLISCINEVLIIADVGKWYTVVFWCVAWYNSGEIERPETVLEALHRAYQNAGVTAQWLRTILAYATSPAKPVGFFVMGVILSNKHLSSGWLDEEPNSRISEYFSDRGIQKPSGMIYGDVTDIDERREMGVEYPFPHKFRPWSGCYLAFDHCGEGDNPLILYAGMTVNLGVRLHQHWSGKSSWMARYWDDHWDTIPDSADGVVFFAIWLMDGKRDRMLFEGKLLGALHPIYNGGKQWAE